MKKPTREQLVTVIEAAIIGKTAISGAVEAADAVLLLLQALEHDAETAYPESFANQPVSILEERANRAKGGADVWTVRDTLLSALRDLDAGNNIPEGFVVDEIQIIMVATGPEKDTAFRYYRRVKSLLSGLGILDTARFDTHMEAKG
jgi:hypothetical protein